MNKKIAPFLLSLLAISILGCDKQVMSQAKTDSPNPEKKGYDLNDAELIGQGYKKIFEENFSTDLSNWKVWEGGAYNNELQLYRANNLKIENGDLVITARKESASGKTLPENGTIKMFDYTSGRAESPFLFSASNASPTVRVSARIQLPLGTGMWPAFWTYGDRWPTNGEIDILEATGKPHSFTTNYFYGKNDGKPDTNGEITVKAINSTDDLTTMYHVFELIWTKDSLTYLLDGKVVDTKSSTMAGGELIPQLYGKLQHVTLNLAVGGNMFYKLDPATIQTGTMRVDWVRVYSK